MVAKDRPRSMTEHGSAKLVAGDLPEDHASTLGYIASPAQVIVGSLDTVESVIVDLARCPTWGYRRSAST